MDFSKFAKYLSDPLVLIGFALFILYFVFKDLIREKIKTLTGKSSEKFTFRLLNSLLFFIFLLIIFGFALKYFELKKTNKSLIESRQNVLRFYKIENLDQKIDNFKFNIQNNDSLFITFKSNKWNFESSFYISKNYKVVDLKNAIVNHFELNSYISIVDNSKGLIWTLSANRIPVNPFYGNKTLEEVGILNKSVITLDAQPSIKITVDSQHIPNVSDKKTY